MQRFLANRLDVQGRLWDRLRQVPDLQAAWLRLLYCAVPRANHLLRAISPDLIAEYARAHDDGIWETFLDLIGYTRGTAADDQFSLDRESGSDSDEDTRDSSRPQRENGSSENHEENHEESTAAETSAQPAGGRDAASRIPRNRAPLGPDPTLEAARAIAFLPIVHGGLGLRSSTLLSPAAHWAAWADILPIIAERAPAVGARALAELEREDSPLRSVAQAVAAETAVTGPDSAR